MPNFSKTKKYIKLKKYKNKTKKNEKNKQIKHKYMYGGSKSLCNVIKDIKNIVIIGMDPVGLLTAIKLRERNYNVTIVDSRFDTAADKNPFERNQVIFIQSTSLPIIGKKILKNLIKYSCRLARPPPMLGSNLVAKRNSADPDESRWSSLAPKDMCQEITDANLDTIIDNDNKLIPNPTAPLLMSIPLNILQKVLYNYIKKNHIDIKLILKKESIKDEDYIKKANYIIFTSGFSIHHKKNGKYDELYEKYCIDTLGKSLAKDEKIDMNKWCSDTNCSNFAIIQDGKLNDSYDTYKSTPNNYLPDYNIDDAIFDTNITTKAGLHTYPIKVFQHERRMFLRKTIKNGLLTELKNNNNLPKNNNIAKNDTDKNKNFYIATVLPEIKGRIMKPGFEISDKLKNTNISKNIANCMIEEALRRYGLKKNDDYTLNENSLTIFEIKIEKITEPIFENEGKTIMFLGDALHTHHFFTGQGVNSGWRVMNNALNTIFNNDDRTKTENEKKNAYKQNVTDEFNNTIATIKFSTNIESIKKPNGDISSPTAFTTPASVKCFNDFLTSDYTTS